MDTPSEPSQQMIELTKLDIRIYLMFALVLITLMGLVLIVFTSAGAKAVRRLRRGPRSRGVPADDWARTPMVSNPLDSDRDDDGSTPSGPQ